ncbi:MAG: glycosyltransferase family 4 protein [Pseudomonadota bacterium]
MRILHLSADFPDPLVPAKTRAVANLLDLVPEHEHRVWSLNRVGRRAGISALDFGPGHRALAYGAPGKGLWLDTYLARVADFVLEDAARAGFVPEAVHAHKLSVEGLVGRRVAEAHGVPLIVSSQGNTDLKIISARPDLRPRWRAVWQQAAVVLPFAPWTGEGLTRLLGPRTGAMHWLPCPTPADTLHPPRESEAVLTSAFHLAGHANKNAALLMRATLAAARQVPEVRLQIAGGGDAHAFAALARQAAEHPARLSLLGPRAHASMPALFNASAAMPLPSKRESYGMALVEALMAGCPVLYSKGTAIDGYLEDGAVSLAVAPEEGAVTEGLVRLLRENAAFKARLAGLQESGGLERFRRRAIAATYRDVLAALG